DREVNAFQRASDVIIQKSLREGFGLTVTEGLWKGRPVVGGETGGIPLQIQDGQNGFLVDSVEACAERTRWLLEHPDEASQMGARGREHVREHFLSTRELEDHLQLMARALKITPPVTPREGLFLAGYGLQRPSSPWSGGRRHSAAAVRVGRARTGGVARAAW